MSEINTLATFGLRP